jgi:tRNA A37 threonylcarbamoyladenosine modification protein TsaB
MNEDDYFCPMPAVRELMGIFHLSEFEAGKLYAAIKDRRGEIFRKVMQRRKQNEEREQRQMQRQPEPEKKEDDWLFKLLILLIILRQKQRLSLNHQLIMSLVGIVNFIDDANETQNESKPEPSKPKL